MKKKFDLESGDSANPINGYIQIIGGDRIYCPYLAIFPDKGDTLFVKGKDMEKLAVNILKSINSKYLRD